jgi:hypothetical protein
VCGIEYSSDKESICKRNISLAVARAAQFQGCVTFGSEEETRISTANNIAHVGSDQQQDGKATDSTTILVSQTKWDAAQRCVRLVQEQLELNRRRLAADLSKSITKLTETTNSCTDGEDRTRKPCLLSSDGDSNRRRPNSLGKRHERRKRRRDFNYEAIDRTNRSTISHANRHSDQYNERYSERWFDSRDGQGSSRQNRFPRVPNLLAMEKLNAPCYLHAYIDPKDNIKKASHLLDDCRQFLELQKLC